MTTMERLDAWVKSSYTVEMFGPRGTMFLEDPRGLHRGIPGKRTMAWARWGVSDPPPSYACARPVTCRASDLGDRYPSDPELRKAIRLVVTE